MADQHTCDERLWTRFELRATTIPDMEQPEDPIPPEPNVFSDTHVVNNLACDSMDELDSILYDFDCNSSIVTYESTRKPPYSESSCVSYDVDFDSDGDVDMTRLDSTGTLPYSYESTGTLPYNMDRQESNSVLNLDQGQILHEHHKGKREGELFERRQVPRDAEQLESQQEQENRAGEKLQRDHKYARYVV